jgi:hypothetical protein
MPKNKRVDTKESGSFRMEKDIKKGVEELAKKENRSFNNMLEVICQRAVQNQ